MSRTIKRLTLVASLAGALALIGGPAAAEAYPSMTIDKSCMANQITVLAITLADYPDGSIASIEGNPIPINTTTTVFITRPIVLVIDSSGPVGDVEKTIRPRPVCRLFR